MSPIDGAELGRRLVEEMRQPVDAEAGVEPAYESLRWGADDLDDETLWAAVMAAVELVAEDGERWQIGDGPVDESIATRPRLLRRWRAARASNPAVQEVYRVMCDPAWNWSLAPNSWWLDKS